MRDFRVRGNTFLKRMYSFCVKKCLPLNKGSVTAEAAVALPVFLCAVVSIGFIIKAVYTHEIIQHAINETANEMAAASYIYHISGLREIHDLARDGMDEKAGLFKEHMDVFFDAFEDLSNLHQLPDSAAAAAENPLEELKSMAFFIAKGEFEDVKTSVCIPVVKLYLKKYLAAGIGSDIDAGLKSLNIADGFEGLDFSRSSFFEDRSNDIDIIVAYKMELPLPFRFLPDRPVIQRATVKAWLGGDEDGYRNGSGSGGEDIWSLDNFTRGNRLRALFGGNLPSSFPVIARFDSGTATMIKSMDLTARSYQDASVVEEKVVEYIEKLRDFRGQEEPWGKSGIVIKESDIKSKRLLLVVPENEVKPETAAALERCRATASAAGIELVVERYGMKKTGNESEDAQQNSE